MANQDAKQTFLEGAPVVAGGIEYKEISALILRKRNGKTYMQVELLDYGLNSVTITNAESVTRKEKEQ